MKITKKIMMPNEAMTSKAWPFVEARSLLKRLGPDGPAKGYVLFQTGYGPSGLPHIGTFAEVARTTMVMHAFNQISDIPTKLVCFSDDMDGLRSVPTNIPNQDEVKLDLNLPLTQVRDPYGTHDSFAAHNNAKLREFLDRFEFEYTFISSTEWYQRGNFDDTLLRVMQCYDPIQAIMLQELGPERRATYSPFMPISMENGHVLQVPVDTVPEYGDIVYTEPSGRSMATSVTGGNCKLQWKVDWAMRWAALEVDYEMSGKDLIDSVKISSRVCKVLGARPPLSMIYEMFLDEDGHKISKSKGNGLSIDTWLRYAAPETLSYFMYQKPKTAKRLFFGVIPKAVDEYHQHLRAYETQDEAARLNNPVWHIHNGNPPKSDMEMSFAMMLNIASAANVEDVDWLWTLIQKDVPNATSVTHPQMDAAARCAVAYYQDMVKPHKVLREATDKERDALLELSTLLAQLDDEVTAEALQAIVYSVGKEFEFDPLRNWFKAIYEVLLGSSDGPRFGHFIHALGVKETISLIEERVK